ncbi:hypothetical protein TDIS_0536 [Thermosulfurimonas dismutans]|uniref:Uncharacterized protein n=1 Tax=Thermosulfurimonas dismutans TaxID=999894 RepID=A0A179D5J4_9BACT|nr:hypothetical protein TDIS_0536 [Thermosulfurimonas dismutans]
MLGRAFDFDASCHKPDVSFLGFYVKTYLLNGMMIAKRKNRKEV